MENRNTSGNISGLTMWTVGSLIGYVIELMNYACIHGPPEIGIVEPL